MCKDEMLSDICFTRINAYNHFTYTQMQFDISDVLSIFAKVI